MRNDLDDEDGPGGNIWDSVNDGKRDRVDSTDSVLGEISALCVQVREYVPSR